MSSRDKKFDDDDEETPASWVAKHTPGYRAPRQLRPGVTDVRRRSDTSETTSSIHDAKHFYTSVRHGQPHPAVARHADAWKNEKDGRYSRNDDDDENSCSRFCDLEDERSCPVMTARLPQSKPFRRVFMLLFGMLAIGYFCFTQAIAPMMAEDWPIRSGFLTGFQGTYGFARGGDYDIAQNKVAELDQSLVPGGKADPHGMRRLIFVGDVHGCKAELEALLKACNFDMERDHVIATGDVISKGPDSPGVIDELMRINATSVRGNHEDRILTLAGVRANAEINQPKDVTADSSKDSRLLESLHDRHLKFIRHLPLILRIPPLAMANDLPKTQKHHALVSEILVVHAGLVPAVPLHKQDPFYVMNMRSLGRRTHVPSSNPASKEFHTLPWCELWNWYHDRLEKGEKLKGWHEVEAGLEPPSKQTTFGSRLADFFQAGLFRGHRRPHSQVVVYGHDSKAGLQDKRWSKGLDSSCVKGGELTAMVLDAHGSTELVSVKCKDHRP